MISIFDKLGGKRQTIQAFVSLFYDRMLKDPDLSKYFKRTDMKKQVQQQTDFVSFALGGKCVYSGKNMFDAHKGMKLTHQKFDKTWIHMQDTLKDMKVSEQIIKQIKQVVETTRKDVVQV